MTPHVRPQLRPQNGPTAHPQNLAVDHFQLPWTSRGMQGYRRPWRPAQRYHSFGVIFIDHHIQPQDETHAILLTTRLLPLVFSYPARLL